jgi:curved DNA-binding protein CbpA
MNHMKGTLTEQPLAELIREISSKGLSGTLRLEHERAQTAIYFDSGQLIYAASNLRALRLREYVSNRGVIAEKDRASLANNLPDLALAASLSASGTLRQKDVDGLLATLVADVLRVALLWTEGSWQFNDRARLDDPVHIQVDTANLLQAAAQRLPLKFVSSRFQNQGETISRASEVPRTSNLLPAESFMLSRLDEPTTMEDLVASSGLGEQAAYGVIYGLALCGLVKREYWRNAFRTEPAKTEEQTSPRVAPETPAGEAGQTGSRWASVSDEEEELEKFLLRLNQATNYYEIMELPPTAGANEIKDAYYALARRYHPDRFHLQFGTQLHSKLSSAFARITQAYERLTDPNARSAYDKAIERSRRLSESAPKTTKVESSVDSAGDPKSKTGDSETDSSRAEHNFREGLEALKEDRIEAASSYLAAASRLAPQEARYRAYYGRALAASEKTRRLAENEIQAAVKLDPASANFRTMLAELYFDLKFHRRAQTEVERALALDPNNASAQSLLRKLEKSRKVG